MCSKDLIFQVGVTPLEENNTTNQRDNGAKSDLDDFFLLKRISHDQAPSNKLTPKKSLRTA